MLRSEILLDSNKYQSLAVLLLDKYMTKGYPQIYVHTLVYAIFSNYKVSSI